MLKQKRREAGLTQKQLAERSGVPMRTIQNWEDHVTEPFARPLKRVADVLGCKVDDLI